MKLAEVFTAKANCGHCVRRTAIKGSNGEMQGWACAQQGITNKGLIPLQSLTPEVTVSVLFGHIIGVSATDANGHQFECRFRPYPGRKTQNFVK